MYINCKKWQRRSGVEITVKETEGAVHNWVVNKKQSEGENLVESAYQELIKELVQ